MQMCKNSVDSLAGLMDGNGESSTTKTTLKRKIEADGKDEKTVKKSKDAAGMSIVGCLGLTNTVFLSVA